MPSLSLSRRDDLGALLDEQHVVPVLGELLGDERADVAGTGDRDPHQWPPPTGRVNRSLQRVERVGLDHEVQDVAFLADEVGRRDLRGAEAGDGGEGEPAGLRRAPRGACPPTAAGSSRSTSETCPLASTQSAASASGRSRRITWSVVHDTVATVGIPSRW